MECLLLVGNAKTGADQNAKWVPTVMAVTTPEMQAWCKRNRGHQGIREEMGGVAMWENRSGTMICAESSFNGEATRTPHPPRRWAFVVDAAVGPLSVTAQLGFRRNKRNLIVAGTPAQELVSPS
jgi:hypothetical protein